MNNPMRRSDDESMSVWQDFEYPAEPLPVLAEDTTADVCIVGAGIAGLSTAYLLANEGRNVVVLDAWGLAAGETGRTTAHLTAVLDERFFELEKLFGEDGARLAAESHMSAIHRIESIVRTEGIECDFERLDGFLVALDDDQRADFDKEAPAVKRAGFADVKVESGVPVAGINMPAPTLCFPAQATFNIAKYIYGLAGVVQKLGGRIFVGSDVDLVKGGDDACVRTKAGFSVAAKQIVVATNTPINDMVKMHTKQAAYRTYVIGYRVPKDSYPGFLLWDMADPYHYARVVRGDENDTLIVGGEDHKTGQAINMDARYQLLDQWTRQYFATLGPITHRWSGQVMEPVDSLAFIGRNPGHEGNVFIATGDSGNGMTHGTIAGMLITDLIQGRPNDWEKLYDPARKSIKSAGEFISENANVVGSLVKEWVTPGDVDNVQAIAPGEGAIVRCGANKIAVHRDAGGQLHQLSAACTHLGCVVQWNHGEKSWDCPCHGSRFDVDGRVLNGPATANLGPAKVDDTSA